MASGDPLRARASRPHAEERCEVRDQRWNVTRSIPQGRYFDGNHVEPEQKVFTKTSVTRCFLQRLVRRCDDAHVYGNRLGTAKPLDLARFNDAQQLGLRLRSKVADFVEQQRAAMRELEPPDPPFRGASECARS
jgi:hypothetical protein